MYYPALVPFLQQFPSSQLFIIRTEDILLNPSSSFQQLARFLDIDPTFFSERNFYQDEQLTEAELISTPPENSIDVNDKKSVNHHYNHHYDHHSNVFIQTARPPRLHVNNNHRDNHPFFSSNNDEPKLSTRYRLQRVFRDLNHRLLEIFDNSKTYFNGWVYDVDRG